MNHSKRPLSPHLQIYSPQLTSMMSIAHRASGVALCAGGLLIMFGLLALADGMDSWNAFRKHCAAWYGTGIIIAFTLTLVYHWLNGIRHLGWDSGFGLDIKQTYATGKLVMLAFVVLSALIIWLAMRSTT
jgi:succinate dehydrogenase / fumarate reductase, cytochrome b subunit